MADRLLPVQRTAATMADYVRAVMRSWHLVGTGVPPERAIGVLFAQYIVETGGRACWNWNFGNAKHVKGDGCDFQMLNGVWEGVSPATAAQLIASGQAVADENSSHAAAVGAGRRSVVFLPPHPATWFRAFASADEGMADHLKLLARRFARAWPAVLAGDCTGFATALKALGYFTADAGVYAGNMKNPFDALVASSTYEEFFETMHEAPEVQAEKVQSNAALLWEENTGSGGVIHPQIEWAPRAPHDVDEGS